MFDRPKVNVKLQRTLADAKMRIVNILRWKKKRPNIWYSINTADIYDISIFKLRTTS